MLRSLDYKNLFGINKYLNYDFFIFEDPTNKLSNFKLNVWAKLDSQLFCHIIKRNIDNYHFLIKSVLEKLINQWEQINSQVKTCDINFSIKETIKSFNTSISEISDIFNDVKEICIFSQVPSDSIERGTFLFNILSNLHINLTVPLENTFNNLKKVVINETEFISSTPCLEITIEEKTLLSNTTIITSIIIAGLLSIGTAYVSYKKCYSKKEKGTKNKFNEQTNSQEDIPLNKVTTDIKGENKSKIIQPKPSNISDNTVEVILQANKELNQCPKVHQQNSTSKPLKL